ncbi:hypothetical protein MKW94_027945, partial [Papaver nudicaule]|nr:hypothetical protein [Papaver nudicaule]
MGTTTLENGQVVNVIDTPGLFDSSKGPDSPDFLANEMVKCITLAKDGIDGIILVCSIKARFSIEEEGVIKSIGEIFGQKIFDYMIVVFTAGDELEEAFPEYLSTCPPSLQVFLQFCVLMHFNIFFVSINCYNQLCGHNILSTSWMLQQEVIQLCKNRAVLFDNRSKEETQRRNQVQQLMLCIGEIGAENGEPYKSEVFEMIKV